MLYFDTVRSTQDIVSRSSFCITGCLITLCSQLNVIAVHDLFMTAVGEFSSDCDGGRFHLKGFMKRLKSLCQFCCQEFVFF